MSASSMGISGPITAAAIVAITEGGDPRIEAGPPVVSRAQERDEQPDESQPAGGDGAQ